MQHSTAFTHKDEFTFLEEKYLACKMFSVALEQLCHVVGNNLVKWGYLSFNLRL